MSCIRYNMRCGVLWVNSATALRRLSLSQWAGDHTAKLSWQELATSLPKLRHLTHLELRLLPVTRVGTAACLRVLTAALSRLTRLRSFSIEGRPSEHEHLERSKDDESWHACFVQALSAMTGLERLRVKHLSEYVLGHHCYVELGRLSALRALALDNLAMGVSHDWTGDDVLPTMLGMMTRLTLSPCAASTSARTPPSS